MHTALLTSVIHSYDHISKHLNGVKSEKLYSELYHMKITVFSHLNIVYDDFTAEFPMHEALPFIPRLNLWSFVFTC